MGDAPSKIHTLDRIRVLEDYKPDNCRWATPKEQARNRTNNSLLTFNGETKTIAEWAEITGLHDKTIRKRVGLGYPIEEILKPSFVSFKRTGWTTAA